MDDLYGNPMKSRWKWMIWGYHHFRKHPYVASFVSSVFRCFTCPSPRTTNPRGHVTPLPDPRGTDPQAASVQAFVGLCSFLPYFMLFFWGCLISVYLALYSFFDLLLSLFRFFRMKWMVSSDIRSYVASFVSSVFKVLVLLYNSRPFVGGIGFPY